MCTQFIRVYNLATDASAPLHTFYLPATAEDASGDGAGSCIRDVVLVPVPSAAPGAPAPAVPTGCGGAPGEAAAPALLATAVVLTGAGKLYGKGLPAPSPSETGSGGGGGGSGAGAAAGFAYDGEVRHRLIIPPPLEQEARGVADGRGGGSGPGRGGGGGDGSKTSESGGGGGARGFRSESIGGASADTGTGGGSGRDDEEVESPVSGMDSPSSPSYLYLSAFAGCDFDDVVNDSPDESLIFAEPGLPRRGGWAGSSAAACSSSAAAAVSAADSVLAMSPVRLAKASAEVAETAAASYGTLHFSDSTGLLVVARGGKSTLALRLRGAGAATEVGGGFVLLPHLAGGAGAGPAGGGGACGSEAGATPVAQGVSAGAVQSEGGGGAAAAAAAAAATNLEANSCLPPYTRFLDYWDGAGDLAGEDGGAGGDGAAAATASLVCVAAGGGRLKANRVLAMRAGGGSGEGNTVRNLATSVGTI